MPRPKKNWQEMRAGRDRINSNFANFIYTNRSESQMQHRLTAKVKVKIKAKTGKAKAEAWACKAKAQHKDFNRKSRYHRNGRQHNPRTTDQFCNTVGANLPLF